MSKRHQVQEQLLDAVTGPDFRSGSLYAGTGVGKTKMSIDYLKRYHERRGHIPKTAFIVPTITLRDVDIPAEFEKWNATKYREKTDFYCYSYVHKLKDKNYDVVILDEGHHFTELSATFLQNNKYKYVLAMTATKPDEEKADLLEAFAPERINYSIDQAVRDGLVKPYKIHVIYTSLNRNDKDVLVKGKDKTFYTTERSNYDFLTKLVNKAKMAYFNASPQSKEYLKNMWFQKLGMRSRFIYNLESKKRVAKKIIDLWPDDQKLLIFTKSIKQAEDLCPYSYHSKTTEEELERFNKGEIKRLSAVNALNEGKNIKDLHAALIVQLDSNPRNFIQRIGRTVRYTEDGQASVIILIARDTQDEKWLEKAMAETNEENIYYHTERAINEDFVKKLYSAIPYF